MKIEKIYIGGWFQRTTLHLTEVADFLAEKKSSIFSEEELSKRHEALGLGSVRRENWLLEFVEGATRTGLKVRYYEDGLVTLEKKADGHLQSDFDLLEDYYDNKFSPAISLLFSKGAPVPKELANIKTLLPFIVVAKRGTALDVEVFFRQINLTAYSVMETPYVKVYKAPKVILIVSDLAEEKVRQLVEGQIFFREFKQQLARYLSIHREIWEEIAAIKERGKISGKEAPDLRARLEDYQKTIQLIDSRIGQMGSYLATRAKIASVEEVDKYLDRVFQYKFETLGDTLSYIKELWNMTKNYLNSALEMFRNIQSESTKTSITSLQLITTIGVVAGIIGYLGRDKLPGLTLEGIIFFIVLLVLTWIFNRAVTEFFSRKSYKFK